MAPEPALGTPLHEIGPVREYGHHGEFPTGVTVAAGVNVEIARHVAFETGEPIAWPFRTVGWRDEGGRFIALVLHQGALVTGRLEVVGFDGGLPWTAGILRSLATALFLMDGLREVAVRVRPEDHALRRFVQRLGFTRTGAEARPGDLYRTRHIYVLTTDAYAARLARRGAH